MAYDHQRALWLLERMEDLAREIQRAPEESEALRQRIIFLSEDLLAELRKPAARHEDCALVLGQKREIARRIRFGTRALLEFIMELLQPSYQEPCPRPSSSPTPPPPSPPSERTPGPAPPPGSGTAQGWWIPLLLLLLVGILWKGGS